MQLSQPAYLRYESGDRTPSIHVINFMANVLNTSVDFLIGKTDDPKPNSYFVNADSNPELFSFVELYNSSDDNIKKRMDAYVHKMSNYLSLK